MQIGEVGQLIKVVFGGFWQRTPPKKTPATSHACKSRQSQDFLAKSARDRTNPLGPIFLNVAASNAWPLAATKCQPASAAVFSVASGKSVDFQNLVLANSAARPPPSPSARGDPPDHRQNEVSSTPPLPGLHGPGAILLRRRDNTQVLLRGAPQGHPGGGPLLGRGMERPEEHLGKARWHQHLHFRRCTTSLYPSSLLNATNQPTHKPTSNPTEH
jgi:hypothetical protein